MVQETSIKVKIREPKTKNEFDQYYNLRWRILRQHWNQPKGNEKDEKEKESIHLLVFDKDKIIGVGRGHFNTKTEAQIRYMAVEERFQGKGVGTKILETLERKLIKKGARTIILNARENAMKFYKKHNYKIIGKGHTLFGVIKHFKMRKEI
ncbi:MAG: GNAT family N-acetyltransferase [Candidatus Cloacimonetes bacterium]|nr:GNAT family N-acetyltransferase [Candidatus Cloacimonadota bacterium]